MLVSFNRSVQPTDIYDTPANTFVAGFIGSPAMNLIDGTIKDGVFEASAIRVSGLDAPDGPVTLGFRAEDASISSTEAQIAAPVYSLELLGDATMVTARVGGVVVAVKADKEYRAEIGDPVHANRADRHLSPLRRKDRCPSLSRRADGSRDCRGRRLRQHKSILHDHTDRARELVFDHFASAARLSPSACSAVSPPTRGSGRPLSVTATATRISFARGASFRRTSIPSKWLRT